MRSEKRSAQNPVTLEVLAGRQLCFQTARVPNLPEQPQRQQQAKRHEQAHLEPVFLGCMKKFAACHTSAKQIPWHEIITARKCCGSVWRVILERTRLRPNVIGKQQG
jgi:hypothetical protein